jgi:hypothetical protein
MAKDGSEGNKNRFNAQCLLSGLWMRGHRAIDYNTQKGNQSLQYTRLLFGNAKTVVNDITGTDTYDTFSEMSSQQAAFLVPQIRLYKTIPKAKKDIEFFFQKGSYTSVQQTAVQSIFNNKVTRGEDVGIESVEIDLLATQPAEVGNHIAVSLNIYFQNFSAFQKVRTSGEGERYAWSDLISAGRVGIAKEKAEPSPKKCANFVPEYSSKATFFDPRDYQIKLFAGWQLPQFGRANGLLGSATGTPSIGNTDTLGFNERKDMGRAIRSTGRMYLLSLKNHTFNFNPDGSFNLEIQYHAAAIAGLNHVSANIFFNPSSSGNKDGIKASEQNLAKLKKDKARRAAVTRTPGEKNKKDKSKNDKEKSEEDKAIEEAEAEVIRNKMEGYTRVFEVLEPVMQVINVPREAINMKTTRKKEDVFVDKNAQGQYLGHRSYIENMETGPCADYEKISDHVRSPARSQSALEAGLQNALTVVAVGLLGGDEPKATKTEMRELAGKSKPRKADVDELANSKAGTQIQESSDVSDEEVKAAENAGLSGEFVKLHYFFFGHLMDRLCSLLADSEHGNPGRKKFKETLQTVSIVAGPASVSDPCKKTFSKEGCGQASQPKYINRSLYNLPISLELFTVWFKNSVIKPQKSVYTFANVLRDVFTSLVIPSLGPGCNDYAAGQNYEMHYDIFNLGEISLGASAFKNWQPGRAMTAKKMTELVRKNRMQGTWKKNAVSTNQFHEMLLFRVTSQGGFRDYNPPQDKKDGIHHILLGKGNGVLLNYSFSKNDAPYLAEAKSLGGGDLGADLSGGAIYNFSCEMLGNGYFHPGQLIYVNPEQLTARDEPPKTGVAGIFDSFTGIFTPNRRGALSSKAPSVDSLRMGGYYIVTSVKSTLKNGEYITSLEAIFEANPVRRVFPTGKEKVLLKQLQDAIGKGTGDAYERSFNRRYEMARREGGYFSSATGAWVEIGPNKDPWSF